MYSHVHIIITSVYMYMCTGVQGLTDTIFILLRGIMAPEVQWHFIHVHNYTSEFHTMYIVHCIYKSAVLMTQFKHLWYRIKSMNHNSLILAANTKQP